MEGYFIHDEQSQVSNQKSQGCCLAVVLADLVGMVMTMSRKDGPYILSPQPLVDAGYHSPYLLQHFCTNIGFESIRAYPFTRAKRELLDERYYSIRKHEKYYLDGLSYFDVNDEIVKQIVDNFGPQGKKFPILGALYLDFFKDSFKYACDKVETLDPYHPPPNVITRKGKLETGAPKRKHKSAASKKEDHAVLITGCWPKPDGTGHYCRIKSSHGEKWENKGYSYVDINSFNYILVPSYEYKGEGNEVDKHAQDQANKQVDHECEEDEDTNGQSKLSKRHTLVYAALPLKEAGILCDTSGSQLEHLHKKFKVLKNTNVDGVIVNICWGIVEPSSKGYKWENYILLFEMVRTYKLKLQVVMCFHEVVDDDLSVIPLPSWVLDIGQKNQEIFFTDKQGKRNYECLSWGVDHEPVLHGRSPLQVYSDLMKDFKKNFTTFLKGKGKVISTIEIGLGPRGELRYPSSDSKRGWIYPGIGEFQCYDEYMSKSLVAEAAKQDYDFCNKIPETGSSYNSTLDQPGFFSDNTKFDSFKSRFFLRWYSLLLIKHGQDVLSAARKVFNRPTTLNAKLSGIHWWYNHKSKSHAAELTAGIFTSTHHDGYGPILMMLKKNGVGLKFAVDRSYPFNESQPSDNTSNLMSEVMDVALELKVPVSSWNVVPCVDEESYLRVLDEALNDEHSDKYSTFNYYGLKPLIENPEKFADLVKKMHGDGSS